jgi:hypothetical protein
MAGKEGERQGPLIMQNDIRGQEPGNRREDTADTQPIPLMGEGLARSGMSHEELVEGFKGFIKHWQARLYQDHGMHFSPLQIIRNRLGMYQRLGNDPTQAIVTPVAMAWNVLAYAHFEPGTAGESGIGKELEMYYQATREPTIKLSKTQVSVVDALAEAVDIPHQKGQAEIEIPEKLRNYYQWSQSEEYLRQVAEARATRKNEVRRSV